MCWLLGRWQNDAANSRRPPRPERVLAHNLNTNNLYSRSDDGSLLFDFGGRPRPTPPADASSSVPLSEPSYKPEYMAKVQAINNAAYGSTTSADLTV